NAASKARKIITVSEASKNDISSSLGVTAEKIRVIYEGHSLRTNFSQNEVDVVKKRYLLNRPYFLFVGVLERKKNIINLTRALDLFLEKYKANVDLVIVGPKDN